MMNDLDELIRADLADLTARPLDLGLDTADLIRAGRQVRRARDLRRAVGTVSVAAAAVVLAWSGVVPLGQHLAPVVPAAPVASPSRVEHPAYFTDLAGLDLESTTRFRRVELAVQPVGAGWDVTATTSRTDGLVISSFTFRAGSGATVQQLSPQVAVALLPSATPWWTVAMTDPMVNVSFVDSSHVVGLDLTAVLLVFDKPGQGGKLAGFVWEGRDGSLVDSIGNAVLTRIVEVSGQQVTVFWDPALELLGMRAANGLSTTIHTRMEWPHAYPRLQQYERYSDGSPEEVSSSWVLADLLPTGAHDLHISLATSHGGWKAVDLGGRTAYVVAASLRGTDQPIRSLSFVDAEGKTQSYAER